MFVSLPSGRCKIYFKFALKRKSACSEHFVSCKRSTQFLGQFLAHAPSRFAADFLAFYQTAAFGAERWAVRYYAPVLRYRIATRRELLPAEPDHPRASDHYYRVEIGPLESLPLPLRPTSATICPGSASMHMSRKTSSPLS